ncbi:MAG: mandelate racemase/muconate lactonizing enzyme family protein [Bryobacterales bacterium]|nr:mandelate racemase/muconate lactonizing enzyme family protein [Bryobacterales bacterium]
MRIKITEVHIHKLSGPLRERFGWSLNWTGTREATLVEVRTDSGLTGWGDGYFGGDLLLRHPELVIGRSPFEAEGIYDSLRAAGGFQERSRAPRCGGLDMALWDLMGKALGQPVCRILGRVYRQRVEPYCTAMYRKDFADLAEGLAAEAQGWEKQGYGTVKMKIGYGVETDLRIVRAVREALRKETALAVDANCAYDAGTAAMLGRRMEPFGLAWWEEPVLANDYEGYGRLRQAFSIPLASGESMAADEIAEHYVGPRLVDIVQPDLDTVGLTGARRLTWLTWLRHQRLIPHNWGTAVRTAANLHWVATIPPLTEALEGPRAMFEFDRTEHPFRDAVVKEKLDIEGDGRMAVPRGEGLGVEVIPEKVAEFRREHIVVK